MRMTNSLVPNPARERGGVSIRILMAVVTLAALGVVIALFLARKTEDQKYHYGNALTIAEYGLGEALMQLGQDFRWREGFSQKEYDLGTYSVKLTTRTMHDTLFLTVESTGKSGSARRGKTAVLRLEVSENGDSLWRQHSLR
jgi:hypothetical protein